MYELVRGPLMWVSFIIFLMGLVYQIVKLILLTKNRETSPYSSNIKKEKFLTRIKQNLKSLPERIKTSVWGTLPALSILSLIFHIGIIITPLFQMGHAILFFESWNINFISLSEKTTDIMTVIFIAAAVLLFLRRIFSARVRSVSSGYDYLLMVLTAAPFVTGFMAYHQLMDYETIIISHMIAGELMLIIVGTTKLSHMIFFFFVRFFVESEYSLGSRRTW